jgi:hypothetical protein
MTRIQFIVAMAVHIAERGGLSAAHAMPIAAQAYQAFEDDNRVAFGDPGFSWDGAAARVVATEYEIACW